MNAIVAITGCSNYTHTHAHTRHTYLEVTLNRQDAVLFTDTLSSCLQALQQLGGQVEVQHLRDDLGPAVDEIQPAIFDLEAAALCLGLRLVQEIQFATVVKFPGDCVHRELAIPR